MPDLGTHVTVAWIAGRAAGWKGGGSWRTLAPFILGSALPDILARAPHLTLRSPRVATLIQGLHTPACLILACLALSFLWQEKGRGRIFLALLGGAAVHCLTDFFQIIWPGNYHWLFPFTRWSPQAELIHDDLTVVYLPFLLVSALILEVLHRRRAGRRMA